MKFSRRSFLMTGAAALLAPALAPPRVRDTGICLDALSDGTSRVVFAADQFVIQPYQREMLDMIRGVSSAPYHPDIVAVPQRSAVRPAVLAKWAVHVRGTAA